MNRRHPTIREVDAAYRQACEAEEKAEASSPPSVGSTAKNKRRKGGHEKIGQAYRENRGVWLTPEDVEDLWHDDAIKSAITQEWAE